MQPQLPPVLAALSARLSQIGFERTRRALAALALSVFISLYLLVSLNAPEGFARVFVALAFCYGVAFFAVVAEWFWGRWFATGLAWSGVMIAIAGVVAVGWLPQLVIFGVLHLFVVVALMGEKMAARYDLQAAWRERYKMDDFGVARLQKTDHPVSGVAAQPHHLGAGPERGGDGVCGAGPGDHRACGGSFACAAGACCRSARPACWWRLAATSGGSSPPFRAAASAPCRIRGLPECRTVQASSS